MTPLPWQSAPIAVLAKALSANQSVLDASDTGTGKTFVACAAAKEAGVSLAVICPKSVIPNWKETAEAVGVNLVFALNIEALKANGRGFLGENPHWSLPNGTRLVFDEVHRFSAPDSDNAKILAAAPRPVLMLSATAADDPTKLRAIGHQLGLTTWRDWWHWCGKNGCKRGHFGGLKFKGTQTHLDNLHRQIFGTGRGVRVRISELGDLFPKTTHHTILVPVEDQAAIDRAYAAELAALKTGVPITDLLRSRQISEHEKLPAVFEMIEDDVASGCSVAVFVNFRDTLERLQDQYKCPVIHGDQTDRERQDAIKQFGDDHKSVIAVMIQAGGCGLNGLQDRRGDHPRVGYLFPSYSAVQVRQTLGRLPRADSVSCVQYKWVFAEGTVEEQIRWKVERKLNNMAVLNDGDLNPDEPIMQKQSTRVDVADRQPNPEPEVHPGKSDLPGPFGCPGGKYDPRGSAPAPVVRAHSAVSPSRLKELEISPRFEREDEEESVYAAAGTRQHLAIETGDDSKLSPEEKVAVGKCRNFLGVKPPGSTRLFETRLDIADGIFGTADFIELAPDQTMAVYIDWKFGQHAQEDAATNPQVQAYVVGMFKKWPKLEQVAVSLIYPYRDEISQATYSRSNLPDLLLRIETVKARVEQAHATGSCFAAHDTCRYCKNRASCPDLAKLVLPIATRYGEHHEMTVPAQWDPALVTNPEQMSKAMALAAIMEKWADSVKFHALKLRQETGQEIPGYDLRQRQGRGKILNPLIAWETARGFGLTQDQFLRATEVSPSKLGDIAGENAARGEKGKSGQALLGLLRDAGVLEVGAETFFLQRSRK